MWTESLYNTIEYKYDSVLGSYTGNGTRVFIENANGTIANLPSTGDVFLNTMVTPNFSYAGITLQTILIENISKADGTGRKATCNYSSTEVQKEDTNIFGNYSGNVKIVSQESKGGNSNWAQYRGDLSGNDENFSADVSSSSGVLGDTLKWTIPNGNFKRRYIADSNNFSEFKTDFVNVAGTVNSTSFQDFDVGNVLLVSFDADYKTIDGIDKWEIFCNYSWQIIPGVSKDGFQYIPSTIYNLETFIKPVRVERSPGAGIVTNLSLLYKYSDLNSFDGAWS
jgi:hypothetical protein